MSTFANNLHRRDGDVLPDLFLEEEDANDPAKKLEKLPTADKMKLKYKELKIRSKNGFHRAVLEMPKTKHMQQKYLEKRILSIDADRLSEPPETEGLIQNYEKEKKKFNFETVSDTKSNFTDWNTYPLFRFGTGKTRYRLKNMFKY